MTTDTGCLSRFEREMQAGLERALMLGRFLDELERNCLGDASSLGGRSAGLTPRAVPSRPKAAAAIADNDR